MALVSVVIPCYNAESYLDETIVSVHAQTGVEWELIVVDDGSTDASVHIIGVWQERLGKRMRTHFGPNRGVSAARNTGTALSRGEFIQYLDADDLLRAGTLAQRTAALAGGADVAYCDWRKLQQRADGGFAPGEIVARSIEDVHPRAEIAFFTSFWCPPAALLYRRSIVSAIGGWNETLPIIQDARFALDAALAGARFVHVPGIGADYRVLTGSSLSTRDPARFALDCFHNACQVEDHWRTNGGLDEEWRAALAGCYDYTARTLLKADYPAFRQNLRRLYGVDPHFRLSYTKLGGWLAKVMGPRAALLLMRWMQYSRRVSIPTQIHTGSP